MVDDEPTVSVSDTPASVQEGEQITGTWTAQVGGDAEGAVIQVLANGGTEYALDADITVMQGLVALGTLHVNSTTHEWTFTANNDLDQDSNPGFTFAIKVTDGDQDFVSESQSAKPSAQSPPCSRNRSPRWAAAGTRPPAPSPTASRSSWSSRARS